MILDAVDDQGVPILRLTLAGRTWPAIVDTGFNGDLELPDALRGPLDARPHDRITSMLAGAQWIEEDSFLVDFPFDGQVVLAEATFAPGKEILLGTHLLHRHRLAIDFVARTVVVEQVDLSSP